MGINGRLFEGDITDEDLVAVLPTTQRNLLEKRSENWSRKVFICVLIICGFTAGGGVFFERYLNEQIYKERVSQLTESTQLLYTNLENTLDSE